jgi:hypothetical protein
MIIDFHASLFSICEGFYYPSCTLFENISISCLSFIWSVNALWKTRLMITWASSVVKQNLSSWRSETWTVSKLEYQLKIFRKHFDAVLLARSRTSYPRIDSLCIIQDSIKDWNKEVSQMGEVYRNAILQHCGYWSSRQHKRGCFSTSHMSPSHAKFRSLHGSRQWVLRPFILWTKTSENIEGTTHR